MLFFGDFSSGRGEIFGKTMAKTPLEKVAVAPLTSFTNMYECKH